MDHRLYVHMGSFGIGDSLLTLCVRYGPRSFVYRKHHWQT